MIILLGGTGYVGTSFVRLLSKESVEHSVLSRSKVDYSNRDQLTSVLSELKPSFLINCAGFTGKPNVDACEIQKTECLAGNALLPSVIQDVCSQLQIPWGHVSSGCIYTGSRSDGSGFTEEDRPNFSFRTDNCSFYSGCKALGEECLANTQSAYLWRLRIPFDSEDTPRNYLSKLMRYDTLLEATNSISHLEEFVSACWQTWKLRAPFGIYNVTNSGFVTTSEVVELIKQELGLEKTFKFFSDEKQFMKVAAKTPRSNCVLDNSKLLATGIKMRDVRDAIAMSLRSWRPQS